MKIGDIVCRKKYHQDISFEIIDIKDVFPIERVNKLLNRKE